MEYYNMTQRSVRDGKAEKYTKEFEEMARFDLKKNQMPSSRSIHYIDFINHRLRYFDPCNYNLHNSRLHETVVRPIRTYVDKIPWMALSTNSYMSQLLVLNRRVDLDES